MLATIKYIGRFKNGLPFMQYYFDSEMNEIGYSIGDGRILTHTQGRKWGEAAKNKLILTEIL
mgnify:CR=1 FL=1